MTGIFSQLAEIDQGKRVPTPKAGVRTGTKTKRADHTPGAVDQPAGRPAGRSTGRLVNRPHDRQLDTSAILGRPKAFYITERQDEDINAAVGKLRRHRRIQERLSGKRMSPPDRSTIVRLVLQEIDLLDDQCIDRLVDRLVD